ncbi:hypothetical protein BT63DRAFT_444220 [Microthyrium microscopicum]|uniref:Uncharacterized protein n=1 Tax=Microthyrium microscopicum TaxID=703497 RepID=A0A6A6TV72_9PEZI|nr:hypothetical protein BT63DRAFT_444220 [Microthyrium microscopicum]
MSEYQRRVAEQRAQVAALRKSMVAEASQNLQASVISNTKTVSPKRPTKPKEQAVATRSSMRIASKPKAAYKEDEKPAFMSERRSHTATRNSQRSRKTINYNEDDDDQEDAISLTRNEIVMLDSEYYKARWSTTMDNWYKWVPSQPLPDREASGTFYFATHPNFTPNKSPEEVFREGAFGGTYWAPYWSAAMNVNVINDYTEMPDEWTQGVDVERYLINDGYDRTVNKFQVRAGQSIAEWENNGWIKLDLDIRGWMQWYTRFFRGRRSGDDARQITRWAKCAGPTGRWRQKLLKDYMQAGIRDVTEGVSADSGVSLAVHQTMHHWAVELRQEDVDAFWERFDV